MQLLGQLWMISNTTARADTNLVCIGSLVININNSSVMMLVSKKDLIFIHSVREELAECLNQAASF